MMRRLGAWAVCLTVALLAGCASPRAARPSGKELYPFQGELEAKLKGTDQERRRTAALLPLRVLSGSHEERDRYLNSVLDYIRREKPEEAIPLLEAALRSDSGAHYQSKRLVGELWLHLKTQGMDPQQKAVFLVKLIREQPDVSIEDFPGAVAAEAVKVAKQARPLLYEYLRASPKRFATQNQFLWSGPVAVLFHRAAIVRVEAKVPNLKEFAPSEEEIELFMRADRDWALMSLIDYLAAKRDPRSLEIARRLWKRYPFKSSVSVRLSLVQDNLASVPGASELYLDFLKSLDAEKPDRTAAGSYHERRVEDLRWRVFAAARHAKPSPALRKYVERFLKRPLHRPEEAAIKRPEDLRAVYDRVQSREWARKALERWEK